jgi:hypothetical protein
VAIIKPNPEPPQWVTVAEFMRVWNVKSDDSVRKWVRQGRIRACRIGERGVRVAVNDFQMIKAGAK